MNKVLLYSFDKDLSDLYLKSFESCNVNCEVIEQDFTCYFFPFDQGKHLEELVYSEKSLNGFESCYPRYIESSIRWGSKPLYDQYSEVRNLFRQWSMEALNIAQNYDACVFTNLPHEGFDIVLARAFELCNKKWFATYQTPTTPKSFQVFDSTYKPSIVCEEKLFYELWPRKKEKLTISRGAEKAYKRFIKKAKKRFNREKISCVWWLPKVVKKIEAKCLNVINDFSPTASAEHKVLFALHYQPELTTSSLSYDCVDQLDYLEKVLIYLKKTGLKVNVFVKEHPIKSDAYRGSFFYKRLKVLKNNFANLGYLNQKTSLEHYDGVITVNGTIGLESLGFGIPVLCHENAYYSDFDGAYSIQKMGHFFLRLKSGKKVNPELIKGGTTLLEGVVDPFYSSYQYQSIPIQKGVSSFCLFVAEGIRNKENL